MADPQSVQDLPGFTRGINRHDQEAKDGQIVDGLNVVSWDGGLRRRPAYMSIAHGPIHLLPEGDVAVLSSSGDEDADVLYADRAGNVVSDGEWLHVACREKFDGIDWGLVVHSETLLQHGFLAGEYWTGAAWAPIPWIMDRTRAEAQGYRFPFLAPGTISWHQIHLVGWASQEYALVAGVQLFAVRLRVVNIDGDAIVPPLSSGHFIRAPGVRCFTLEPVRGLMPAQVRNGARSILAAGDHAHPTSDVEKGAQIGLIHPHVATRTLHLVNDEGMGIWDVYSWPLWRSKAATDPAYVEEPPAAAPTTGIAGRLSKGQTSYVWDPVQFAGAALRTQMAPAVAGSVSSFAVLMGETVEHQFRHCHLLCTTLGGTPLGQIRLVRDSAYDSGTGRTTFYVYPAFSVAPTTSARFALYAPPFMLRWEGRPAEDPELYPYAWPILANTQHTLTLATELIAPWGTYAAHLEAGPWYSWEIGRELRWIVRGAQRWAWAMSSSSADGLLLTNGECFLRWDGERLRTWEADTTSENARAVVGLLDEADAPRGTPGYISSALVLRSAPPVGPYLAVWKGMVFVGPISNRPHDFAFSAGGPNGVFANIWPVISTGSVTDKFNQALQGFFQVNGSLYAFTTASIHEVEADIGAVAQVRERVAGRGFLSHHAMATISREGYADLACGPAGAGIGAYDGSTYRMVLPDWTSLVENGVNKARLDLAVATVWPVRKMAFWGVPARGCSYNNLLVAWDYENDAWWLWSAPFGVASLGLVKDINGGETLLIGTEDGFVQTLVEAHTDDGSTIIGRARTAPMRPNGVNETDISALYVLAEVGGPEEALTLRHYLDRSRVAVETTTLVIADDDPAETGWDVGLWDTDVFSTEQFRTRRVEIPQGLRAHTYQVEIAGNFPWRIQGLALGSNRLGQQGKR